MRKLFAAALILVGSTAWGMTNMPDGEYLGKGRWQDSQGQKGSYNLGTLVKSGVVSSTYTFDGKTEKYEFEARSGSNGLFYVFIGGHKVGRGYCKSVQCHYQISIGETVLEETLTFDKDNFYRVGSKQMKAKTVTWEESMQRQEN